MIHVPGMSHTWGTRTSALVELVDVMPTVSALAGLPVPAGVDGQDQSTLFHSAPTESSVTSPVSVCGDQNGRISPVSSLQHGCVEGIQRHGVCNNADKHTFIHGVRGDHKFAFAFCMQHLMSYSHSCTQPPLNIYESFTLFACQSRYTVRTAEWRYTACSSGNKTLTADFDGPHAFELYNHSGDNSYEMDNYENEVRSVASDVSAPNWTIALTMGLTDSRFYLRVGLCMPCRTKRRPTHLLSKSCMHS